MKIKTEGRATSNDSLSLNARMYHTRKFLPKNCEVLEVGCGNGFVSEMLVENGCKVTGFDFSKESVKSINVKGNFTVSDFYSYKTRKKFDYVLCLEVLEHLDDERKALNMLHDWLKPDGKLLLSVPTMKFSEEHKAMGHIRHYSDYERFEKLLESCGFSVSRKKEWGSFIRRMIFSRHEQADGPVKKESGTMLKKIIKPFMYLDTRSGLFKDGLIAECVKK